MNKLGRGLLAGLLLISSTAQTALKNDRTFLAHRDDISNIGMDWVTRHHYQERGDHTNMGASFTVTPFYSESTNHKDLARLFGMGETSQIKVTGGTRPTTSNQHSALYSFNIDHAPNADGSTAGQIPMSGTVNFKPKRRSIGAHLNWDHSLDTVLKGLRLSLRAPITYVSTTMKASFPSKVTSAIQSVDGTAADIDQYFKGDLSKAIATSSHVIQESLTRQKFDDKWHSEVGVGDVIASLSWQCFKARRMTFGVSASLQLPTGNQPKGEWKFEPITGGRGHTAAGLGANIHLDGINKGALKLGLDIVADWKYYFKGVEMRTLDIYDRNNAVTLPGSSYRNLMQHKQAGVMPAANVMTVKTDVTPGHQFDGLVGVSASWHNWYFDVGYNVYLREKEKVEHKTWSDDTYAVAHNRYSMYTSNLTKWIIGGGVKNGGDTAGDIEQSSGTLGTGDYNDANSPVDKHQNYIGANGDTYNELFVREDDFDDDGAYPGAYTSMNGPIQSPGKTTSALSRRSSFYDSSGDPLDADDTDALTANVTGVDIDVVTASGGGTAGTLAVNYNTTTANAVTENQVTHSVVGGLGYRFQGNYPVVAAIGAQGEFQDATRNSALEGWKVWMKFGVSF